eukprot:2255831-Prymnesium_polylepis.1
MSAKPAADASAPEEISLIIVVMWPSTRVSPSGNPPPRAPSPSRGNTHKVPATRGLYRTQSRRTRPRAATARSPPCT